MNTKLTFTALALIALSQSLGCETIRKVNPVTLADAKTGRFAPEFRVVDGFPRPNEKQSVELAILYKATTNESGAYYALLGREGFMGADGTITDSRDPAIYEIHHSVPMLRLTKGWVLIDGTQSVVETDKTTTHSWGTRFLVWARPAEGNRPRQDVIVAINNPVCATVGVDLNLNVNERCNSGTVVPVRHFLSITYPDTGAPIIAGPLPIGGMDQETADFYRFARKRAAEMHF